MMTSTFTFSIVALVLTIVVQDVSAFKKVSPVSQEKINADAKFIDLSNFFNRPSKPTPTATASATPSISATSVASVSPSPSSIVEMITEPSVSPESDLFASPSPAF